LINTNRRRYSEDWKKTNTALDRVTHHRSRYRISTLHEPSWALAVRMNLDLDQLKSHLIKALDGTLAHADLTRLVTYSRVLVQNHLSSKLSIVSHLCRHHGISDRDLSFDCLGELFVNDEKGQLVKIARLEFAMSRPLRDIGPGEIFVAFRGLVVKIADAHLARLYGQSDPEGARIYRNLREAVKQHDCLSLQKTPSGLVLRSGPPHGAFHLYPVEPFERECRAATSEVRSTPEFIQVVHKILTEGSSTPAGIPLFEVVRIFKAIQADGRPDLATESTIGTDGLFKEDLERMNREVLGHVKEKIVLTYLVKQKISRAEAEDLYAAVEDIVSDWSGGTGDARSYHDYFVRHRAVEPGEYDTRFRTKLEYLVKLAREEFAAWLVAEL
jgi:hypothetical protein